MSPIVRPASRQRRTLTTLTLATKHLSLWLAMPFCLFSFMKSRRLVSVGGSPFHYSSDARAPRVPPSDARQRQVLPPTPSRPQPPVSAQTANPSRLYCTSKSSTLNGLSWSRVFLLYFCLTLFPSFLSGWPVGFFFFLFRKLSEPFWNRFFWKTTGSLPFFVNHYSLVVLFQSKRAPRRAIQAKHKRKKISEFGI